MQPIEAARRLGLTAAAIAFWAAGYFGAARLAPGPARFSPATFVDAWLPCAPASAWLYLGGLLLPLLPGLLMPARLLSRTFLAYALLIGWATIIFVAAPTDGQALRAQCPAASAWALEALRRADPPANLFPSLHVGFAVLATLCAARAGSRWAPLVAAAAAAEAVAVCLTKQHYAADVLAGALLALAAYAASFSPSPGWRAIQFRPRRKKTSRPATSPSEGSGSEAAAARAWR